MEKKTKEFFKTIPGKLIIVASLLSLIVVISYLVYFKYEFQFQENEKMFLDGVKEYFERNPNKLPEEGKFTEVSLLDMYKMEYVDGLLVPGKNKVCSEDGFVRVIKQANNYKYLVSLTCGKYKSKLDNEKPEITLKGSTQVIHLGDTYQELGVATVKDNKDKLDIKDVVIDTTRVNLTQTGTYKVIYTVYDNSYNKGVVEREVIVADTLSGKIEREKGNSYVFKGNASDNYVLFSGMLFRVVKVNGDNTTMLITDNNIANLAYSTGNINYSNSNIYTWLNEYFYSNLNENSKQYLVNATWCYDMQNSIDAMHNCSQNINSYVGLLSLNDFTNSKLDNNSYLLNGTEFSLLNLQDNQGIWATSLEHESGINPNTLETLTGVRPVIILKSDICITSGSGTMDNPYKLQDYSYGRENDLLKTRLVGEYVHYSGYSFRISKILENGQVELISSDLLKNQTTGEILTLNYQEDTNTKPSLEEEKNIYYQLNNEIINHISEKYIVKNTYEIPLIDINKKYNELEHDTITSYFALPKTYEMFSSVNGGQNQMIYWLSDYKDSRVSFVNPTNGLAFQLDKMTYPSNAIKLKLTLKSELKILSGKGTVNSPYYLK